MKNLGKVLRTTQTTGRKREDVLQEFLRAYRATPHSTTKVPPALLMMGQCRTSTLPSSTPASLDAAHILAKANDKKAKLQMEAEYNRRVQARLPNFHKGELVLIKQDKTDKSTPRWNTSPYRITDVKGSMLTVENSQHKTTRNSSFFKKYLSEGEDDTEDGDDPTVELDRGYKHSSDGTR